jgi:hypothetical protein
MPLALSCLVVLHYRPVQLAAIQCALYVTFRKSPPSMAQAIWNASNLLTYKGFASRRWGRFSTVKARFALHIETIRKLFRLTLKGAFL